MRDRIELLERIAEIAREDTACGCCRDDAARRRWTELYYLGVELDRLDSGRELCGETACRLDKGHKGYCPSGPLCPTDGCYEGPAGHEGDCEGY